MGHGLTKVKKESGGSQRSRLVGEGHVSLETPFPPAQDRGDKCEEATASPCRLCVQGAFPLLLRSSQLGPACDLSINCPGVEWGGQSSLWLPVLSSCCPQVCEQCQWWVESEALLIVPTAGKAPLNFLPCFTEKS